jgi:hypothetical protein
MAKLTDIDVERVDGVDEPATRRKFLIIKSEEPDEMSQNVRELLGKIENALRLLAKAEELNLSDEAAEALNEVAKTVGLEDVTFKAKAKSKDEEEEEEYGYPPPAKQKKEAALDVEELAAAVAKAVVQSLQAEVAKSAKPASRQPVSYTSGVKKQLGEGLFTDIIFGR